MKNWGAGTKMAITLEPLVGLTLNFYLLEDFSYAGVHWHWC